QDRALSPALERPRQPARPRCELGWIALDGGHQRPEVGSTAAERRCRAAVDEGPLDAAGRRALRARVVGGDLRCLPANVEPIVLHQPPLRCVAIAVENLEAGSLELVLEPGDIALVRG